jgi:hypothetical protein
MLFAARLDRMSGEEIEGIVSEWQDHCEIDKHYEGVKVLNLFSLSA